MSAIRSPGLDTTAAPDRGGDLLELELEALTLVPQGTAALLANCC
jgi:hypothetical protein